MSKISQNPHLAKIANQNFLQRQTQTAHRQNLLQLEKQEEEKLKFRAKDAETATKPAAVVNVNDDVSASSKRLYGDNVQLSVPGQKNAVPENLSMEEIGVMKAEVNKLRLGRRTFGGFNPKIQKVTDELNGHGLSVKQMLADAELHDTDVVLARNIKANAKRNMEVADREAIVSDSKKRKKNKDRN